MTNPLRVTAITASAQLGGTERVLLDFAARAFEFDIALRVLTPKAGPLIEILNPLGVPAEVVPGPDALLRGSQQPSRLISLIPALATLPRWAGALSRHALWRDADVIYTIAFKAHLAAILRHDRPVVWHLHEFPPAVTGPIWKLLAGRSPEGLIANSRAVAEAWGKREATSGKRNGGGKGEAGSGKRISVVRNGVDLDRFKPRQRTFWIHDQLGIPRDRRLIGMPAVFARWKGQLDVLAAFEMVQAEFPDTHLVFVGGSIYDTVAERTFGDELRKKLEHTLPAGRIPLPVSLLPFQTKIELVYSELDLAIHYSLRPEPFGRVVLEAMACGVPVIAAAEGGPLEILDAGSGTGEAGRVEGKGGSGDETPEGWLALPREPRALAHTLRRALGLDPQRLAEKGIAARARAEEQFSARKFARAVAAVLWEGEGGTVKKGGREQ